MTLEEMSRSRGNLRRLPIVLALIFALTLTVSAQQTAAAGNWSRVQVLPAGTTITVNTAKSHTRCELESASANALTCLRGRVNVTFQRADIQTIKVRRTGRSTLVGAIPGAVLATGAGIALGAENCAGQFFCGLGAGLLLGLGALLAVIGAGIGALTDFTGPTISLR